MSDTAMLVRIIRKVLPYCSPDCFNLSRIAKETGLPEEQLTSAFTDLNGLVDAVLNYEQQSLEEIFSHFSSEDINAIDWLLIASKEIDARFDDISPSIPFDLRNTFAHIRQKYIEKRIRLVSEKIQNNFETGIRQGFYRHDLSKEMISRIYISRLLDLHNPDYFPNSEINFTVLFEVMFDTFIRGICTPKGILYYEQKLPEFKM